METLTTNIKQTYSIKGMTCSGCVATVKRALSSVENINGVVVNLEQAKAEIDMNYYISIEKLREALQPFPHYQIYEEGFEEDDDELVDEPVAVALPIDNFWQDQQIWKRASFNTLNCLIGCSIGDFMMIILLQSFYPSTSMPVQMVLATVAGLVTSVSLETVLLKSREKMNWSAAFQMAISMSFISMIAMELVMNATDFMITGGKAAFGNPMYWTALVVAMMAGFLAPLPYNYYKLKKYNKACH